MAENYEYNFISVELKGGFFSGKPKGNYRDIINEQAQHGWRFVQAFAPPVGYDGMAAAVDLVFERVKG